MALGLPPWGVATIDLKTPECGHHILFLSQDLQNEGGNSHDDRTGRISARPPMGQARPWEYTYHSRGDGWLGRHPISLAQGALPGHDAGAHRAAPAGLPGWSTLDAGRGPWLSERRPLCPVTPGWHGLQRAVAPERLGDRGWGLCDGQCASGGWAVGRRAADGRDDRAWHPGAATGPGCHRRECRGGDAAAP